MSDRIAIVVVTHNRRAMLQVALRACLAQPAQHLFVVNNASSDGTKEYLDSLAAGEPRLTLRHLPDNIGGAGGFAEGMRLAYEAGYDWFWLMDDDVEPTPGALQALAARAAEIGRPCCLYPAKRCADGRIFDFEYAVSRRTLRRRRVSSLGRLEAGGLVPSNSGNFEGAFLHRDVVAKIGLPDSRFFICWDDAFYGLRAAEHMPCCYFNTVCIQKQVDKERFRLGGKGYLSSTLFSRCHFLRNYWEVLRYLKERGELSVLAYAFYGWECVKAAVATLVTDRKLSALTLLRQAAAQGRQRNFSPLKMESE